MTSLPVLFRLCDGIRGHMFQTGGIRDRMKEIKPIETMDLEVPHLTGKQRINWLKLKSRRLPSATSEEALAWLKGADGDELVKNVETVPDFKNRPCLFMSAGSGAAPYCLALAKTFSGTSCVVMTPSVLGTEPFDLAIVPKHDGAAGANTLVTLGAPNSIDRSQLEEQAANLLSDYPARRRQAWGLLIGGDDQNYAITPLWAENVLPRIFKEASFADVDLYITTSRRTSQETEHYIFEQCRPNPQVRMLLLASKDPRNPVPGILGHCSVVFCTEDSVSMISESVTAGVKVVVLTVGHCHGLRGAFQSLTENLVETRLLSPEKLWGVPRFSRMIEDFETQGFLRVLSPRRLDEDLSNTLTANIPHPPFNEAARAAKWILARWPR